MKGKIVNYTGGRHTQHPNKLIIIPEGVNDKEKASKLIGKAVEWTTPSGKKISGKAVKVHGRNGSILVRFEKGLPGQALGTDVEIL
ncbi:MAG: 50S ribosomal protein L35ae [Candidatus Altiarchaeota archaeon]|nr:50S ribosomal protein L35ae [Candidatus Altiarchaeota archaeon]